MMIAVDHPCPTWLARAINRPVIRPSRYCRSDLGRLSWSLPSMRTSSLVVTSHYACWHNDTVPRCHASSSLVWSVQCTGEGSMDADMLCCSRKVALASGQSSRRRHRLSPRWTQLPRFPQPQLLPKRSLAGEQPGTFYFFKFRVKGQFPYLDLQGKPDAIRHHH